MNHAYADMLGDSNYTSQWIAVCSLSYGVLMSDREQIMHLSMHSLGSIDAVEMYRSYCFVKERRKRKFSYSMFIYLFPFL